MNQIYAKAYLEATRETVVQSIAVRKPDSVLEYTCFDQQLALSADQAAGIFTETTRWENMDVPTSVGGGGFFGSFLKQLGVEATIDGFLGELEGTFDSLKLDDALKDAVDGMELGEAMQTIKAQFPEAAGQIEELTGESLEDMTSELSDHAKQQIDSTIDDAKQQVKDAVKNTYDSAVAEADAMVTGAVNGAISKVKQVANQAVGPVVQQVANAQRMAAEAVQKAERLTNVKQLILDEAEAELSRLEQLAIDKYVPEGELLAAEQLVERAQATVDAASSAAETVKSEANRLAQQATQAAERAQEAAQRLSEFEQLGDYVDPDGALAAAEELTAVAEELTAVTQEINEAADQVISLADSANQIIEDAAALPGQLLDAGLGYLGLDTVVEDITGAISDFLSLHGIQSTTEIDLGVLLEPISVDNAIDGLISMALSQFGANFSHAFLGGALGEGAQISIDYSNGSVFNATAQPPCDFMNQVYFAARCEDFALNSGFMSFSQLAGNEFRNLPEACGAPNPITTEIIDIAKNNSKQFAAVDVVDPLLEYMDAQSCQPPIPTGIKVARVYRDVEIGGNVNVISQNTYDDAICVNPGCYYTGTSCSR